MLCRLKVSACETVSFSGTGDAPTNFVASALMDMAGNPYGTYDQEEPCVHCGATLVRPTARTLTQKLLTKAAFYSGAASRPFHRQKPNWIHVLFRKREP